MKEKEEMGEVEERKKGGRREEEGKDRLFYVHIVKRVAREGTCSFPFLFSEDNEWRLLKKKIHSRTICVLWLYQRKLSCQ